MAADAFVPCAAKPSIAISPESKDPTLSRRIDVDPKAFAIWVIGYMGETGHGIPWRTISTTTTVTTTTTITVPS